MEDPSNMKEEIEYDVETGNYLFDKKIGEKAYRSSSFMEFDEYLEQQRKKSISDYWQEKASSETEYKKDESSFKPQLEVESETFDRIFGGNKIDIKPTGSAELRFGVRSSRNENPVIPERQRRLTTFQYDQSMQLNILGNIGDKVKVTTNYNTDATFNFDNRVKLDYTGYEDEILQDIEMGNVSLPLSGSLITGSQSLIGLKTKMKFGKLFVTTVLSQQQSKRQNIRTEGGAQITEFEVKADRYESDRHYFLSHFFRDQYETAVAAPPMYNTGVNITRIEVWVTNLRTNPENPRDMIAFQDLGETNPDKIFNRNFVSINQNLSPADNEANTLYNRITAAFGPTRSLVQSGNILDGGFGFDSRLDYQKVEFARKLDPSEFELNPQLGYISLRQQMNMNQVLAVAYEYTFRGQVYQVGEFSTDIAAPAPLILKLLKSVERNTSVPMWDLMMKNIYNIGAYQVQPERFMFDVWYLDQNLGIDINYIPEEGFNDRSLVQLLGLDKLNVNQKPTPDGLFDFLPNFTIIPQNGRVIFPLLEPFGSGLRRALSNPILAQKYAFDSLYTRTQQDAQNLFPAQNRFSLKGEYKASGGNEIMLNAINVPEGSVTVSAGGRVLQENVHYTVDYNMGRVKIIDQGLLESNTPIDVSLETNEVFAMQQKTLIGNRLDYQFNKDLAVGATVLRLSEKPITQKIDYGNEPVTNTIWGVDGTYKAEMPILTKLVDKIPLIDTKEKSSISVAGEFAQLLPGHSRAIGRSGNSYLDDFEGSQSFIDLKSMNNWQIASTPQNQAQLFPEGNLFNDLENGYRRALINWRIVDPLFYQNIAPAHIRENPDMTSDNRMRQIFQTEVFPNMALDRFTANNIPVLDVSFYPDERGPYNFGIDDLNEDGSLANPTNKWGGIMRRIDQNDFEAANIEFLQFWVMDPFNEDADPEGDHRGGDLYFNFGNISEDVMYDGQNMYEQSLPRTEAEANELPDREVSVWGRITPGVPLAPGFDNDPNTRGFQDVGLDGLRDEEEQEYFATYLEQVEATYGTASRAYQLALQDPAADNYRYYRDDDYDDSELNILERYKRYNGMEGNSPTREQYETQNAQGYPTSATTAPDKEDINADNVINNVEGYYQYRVRISPDAISPAMVGQNFITDVMEASVTADNGELKTVRWYQFKIPLRGDLKERIGNISDFRSIRFMRMFLTGFDEEVHLRFARLELIRGEWRQFLGDLDDNPEGIADDKSSVFNIRAVSIEENGARQPVNYVLPPNIRREVNFNTANLQQLNEQAMALEVCGLRDGFAKASFRQVEYDLRRYKTIRMAVHAESLPAEVAEPIQDNDLMVFIRFGTDFEEHYYEYEIPLKVTPPGFYLNDIEAQRELVWPIENEIDLSIERLRKAKLDRDREIMEGGSPLLRRKRYKQRYRQGNIYVVGTPNLGDVKTIMIGVRNPRQSLDSLGLDDGLPKCGEIWVNELRVSNFEDKAGWAATGRVNAKLADLASVSVSGRISTPGFGSIEQKVNERQLETRTSFDASSTVRLDKFFPEKSGVQIPMYVGYAETTSNPQFSPLAEDVPFKEYVEAWDTKRDRDSVKQVIQDKTIRRSINFTNVKKNRTNKEKPSMPYDIENFSASYSYAEELNRDFDTERDITKTYRGGINYAYTLSTKPYKPFSKIKPVKRDPSLAIIRDFQFSALPKSFGFQTNMNRVYNERQIRNNNPGIRADLPAFFNKTWTWDRVYTLSWDITGNLKMDFNANNQALVDEPNGIVNKDINDEGQYDRWRDSVRSNIANFGETMNYRHGTNLSYNIPLNKIPALNWMTSNLRHNSTYNWQRAPFAADTIGHTIQNSSALSWNANFNLRTLYNKVDYLKKVQQEANKHARRPPKVKAEKGAEEPEEGAEETERPKIDDKKSRSERFTIEERFVNTLMSLQSASLSYSENRGILLPGFDRRTQVMGMDQNFEAPGLGFIFGQQGNFGGDSSDFAPYAASQGWLVEQPNLNNPAMYTYSQNINLNASATPIQDLRITFTGSQQRSESRTEFYRWNPDSLKHLSESPVYSGSFSTSFSSWRTAFVPLRGDYSSATFDRFLEIRSAFSDRLSEANAQSEGTHAVDTGNFKQGYGATSVDVLTPAFLAAYGGKPIALSALSVFDLIPRLNWRVNYTGLGKLPALKKYFKTFNLTHGYNSTVNVGGFVNNQRYADRDGDGFPDYNNGFDLDSNFISQFQFNSIVISEQFSPLFGLDMTFNNSVQARFEVRRSRNVTLNPSNSQVMEMRSEELVIGGGYTFKDVKFPIEFQPGKVIKSDFQVRGDVSVRDNLTVIHRISNRTHEATAGMRVFSIKFTGDYKISTQLTLRAFYDRIMNTPAISNSFPTATTNAGIALRFTLS